LVLRREEEMATKEFVISSREDVATALMDIRPDDIISFVFGEDVGMVQRERFRKSLNSFPTHIRRAFIVGVDDSHANVDVGVNENFETGWLIDVAVIHRRTIQKITVFRPEYHEGLCEVAQTLVTLFASVFRSGSLRKEDIHIFAFHCGRHMKYCTESQAVLQNLSQFFETAVRELNYQHGSFPLPDEVIAGMREGLTLQIQLVAQILGEPNSP
jgi:hypothetical protein